MNVSFLLLVAAPLCLYIIVLLMSMGDLAPTDARVETETSDAPAHTFIQSETAADDVSSDDTRAVLSHPAQIVDARVETEHETAQEIIPAAIAAAAVTESPRAQNETIASADRAAPDAISENENSARANDLPDETHSVVVSDAVFARAENVSDETAAQEIAAQEISVPAENADAIISHPDARDSDADRAQMQNDETAYERGPVILPGDSSPKFVFDYRGRLWVEKKRKGFFRQLRRPQLPPDEPR